MIAVNITGLPEPVILSDLEQVQIKSRVDYLRSRYLRKYRNVKRRSILDIELPIRTVSANEVGVGDWLLLPRRTHLPSIDFTPEQLYVMGFWLAEGHYIKSTGQFTFGQPVGIAFTNTQVHFLEVMKHTLLDWFPHLKCNIHAENMHNELHHTKYVLEIWSQNVANFFYPAFGEYSGGKHISTKLYAHSGLLPLVCGFIDGDGSTFSKGHAAGYVVIVTTSQQLAFQMRQILLDEGVWISLQTKDGLKANHARQYRLSVPVAYVHKLTGATKVKNPEAERTNHLAIPAPEGFYARVKNISIVANT